MKWWYKKNGKGRRENVTRCLIFIRNQSFELLLNLENIDKRLWLTETSGTIMLLMENYVFCEVHSLLCGCPLRLAQNPLSHGSKRQHPSARYQQVLTANSYFFWQKSVFTTWKKWLCFWNFPVLWFLHGSLMVKAYNHNDTPVYWLSV